MPHVWSMEMGAMPIGMRLAEGQIADAGRLHASVASAMGAEMGFSKWA